MRLNLFVPTTCLVLLLGACSQTPKTIGMVPEALEAIKTGMSNQEVNAVLGQAGEKQSETDGAALYSYRAPSGFALVATYRDGKLLSIAKVAEAESPRQRLVQPLAVINAVETGEESYFTDSGHYAAFGAVGTSVPAGSCPEELPADVTRIVSEPADIAAVKSGLGISLDELFTSKWKMAVETTGSGYRVAVEGTAPETRGLSALYDKTCGKVALDGDSSK